MQRKKRLEFYQKIIVFLIMFTVLCCLTSYLLAFLGLDTVTELSVAIVQTCLLADVISLLGYAGQNSVRAWAADKYGFGAEDITESE